MSGGASTGTQRPPDPIRVLVADDEQSLREALCDLVAAEVDMEVIGAASDGAEAISLAQQTAPDVALLDLKMAGGGAHAAAHIRSVSPKTRVVALSAYEDHASVLEMLRGGAVAYLVKGTVPGEILEAIRRASRGQASISAAVASAVIEALSQDIDERRQSEAGSRRSEQKFRGLLESAPDAVVIVAASGRIVFANQRTKHMFGYEHDELMGRRIEVLLPERLGSRHVGHRADYMIDPLIRPMGVGLEPAGRGRMAASSRSTFR